jgi:tRNA threonylcarbamoyladenosine biosynthesis protein TsaE
MSTVTTLQISSHHSDETEALAARLAVNLRGGEVIELKSDLGGGKTTFTRGLVRALGSKDHVSSPTFMVCKEYQSPKYRIVHFDFYRLADASFVAEALSEALLDAGTICIVEWGDIVDNVLPKQRLLVSFERASSAQDDRTITMKSGYDYLLNGLKI